MEIKDIFLKLVKVGSPSGYEEPMIKTFMAELEKYVDEVYSTPRGNVVGYQKGSDPKAPSVAIAAHMDQVGFVVSNIDSEGFVRFRRLGGSVIRAIEGQHLRLITEKGPVLGVAGLKPGHITTPEEAHKIPPIEEMYIDIGAKNKKEAESMGITIGTPIVSNAQPIELANDLIASAAVDDRAGLTVLISTAKALKDVTIPSTVYYIGTVEEETSFGGAEVALYDIDVDMAVAVDTFPAGYQPDVNLRDLLYEVGKGPAIHVGEISRGIIRIHNHRVRKWLVKTAKDEGIPYQSGLMHGGTDAYAMSQIKSGIPSATLGVPRRYSHSPVEVFDLKDLANLVKIIVAALKNLSSDFDLLRI